MIDLEKLSQKKLRDLQKFVRNRIIQMEQRARNNQNEKNEITNLDMYESDESSFPTDGDRKGIMTEFPPRRAAAKGHVFGEERQNEQIIEA